jgi:hypothetical protein
MRVLIFISIIFFVLNCSVEKTRQTKLTRSISGGKKEKAKPWPVQLWHSLVEEVDRQVYSLSNQLFKYIEKFETKIIQADYGVGNVKMSREVRDNQDILNTYTVIDRFSISGRSENLSKEIPINVNNIGAKISLGIGGDFSWMNIRQVSASRFASLPRIDIENHNLLSYGLTEKELEKIKKKKEKQLRRIKKREKKNEKKEIELYNEERFPKHSSIENKIEDEGGEIYDYNNQGHKRSWLDRSFRPRINKIWNPVTMLAKVPYGLNQLLKLEDGELVSYTINGYVSLGASIGWSLIPNERLKGKLSASIGYSTSLRGNYRITVLKENDRFVRVKLTRLNSLGHAVSLNQSATDFEFYEGFILFEDSLIEQKNILKQKYSIFPFQFRLGWNYSKIFDIGYRYDLRYPEAQEAFKKSIYGNFKLSDKLKNRYVEANGDQPVEKLFERHSNKVEKREEKKLSLKILNKETIKRQHTLVAQIELPNGNKQILKKVNRTDRNWQAIWGQFERRFHSFTISADKTGFLKDEENSIQLIAESNVEDSHTSGKEMHRYMYRIESILGNKDILPELPIKVPRFDRRKRRKKLKKNKFNFKKAQYKRSQFYFGFNISQKQLEKFIMTHPTKMWGLLEKAFRVKAGSWETFFKRSLYRSKKLPNMILNGPLYLANSYNKKGGDVEIARKIYQKWIKLNSLWLNRPIGFIEKSKYYDKTIRLLSEIFKTKYYDEELFNLIVLALEDEELDYFLVATNNSFDRIQESGRAKTNPEKLLNLTDENMGFERLAGGYRPNYKVNVNSFKVEMLENNQVEVEFDLDHDSKLLFFKLYLTNGIRSKSLTEFVFLNKGRFKKGKNKLVLNSESFNKLEYELGQFLKKGEFYTLSITSSEDGYSWSRVASRRFRFSTYNF